MIYTIFQPKLRIVLNKNYIINSTLFRNFSLRHFINFKSLGNNKRFYKISNGCESFSSLFKKSEFRISKITQRSFSQSHIKNVFEGNKHTNNSYSKKRSTVNYIVAVGVIAVGLSYAAVPLYRIFCQAYSYGGTVQIDDGTTNVESLVKRPDREIKIRFNADTSAAMTWNFKPQQSVIKLIPGETALAFYSARNPTDKQVIGISTYNVLPYEAGQYFNKIQCFCFEEQMLNPKEEVNMPVFFYIDPEFADDPFMEKIDEITLSYTFFEVKEGHKLPIQNYIRK